MKNLDKVMSIWTNLNVTYKKQKEKFGENFLKEDFIKKLVGFSQIDGRCNVLQLKTKIREGLDLNDNLIMKDYSDLIAVIDNVVYKVENNIFDGIDNLDEYAIKAPEIHKDASVFSEDILYELDMSVNSKEVPLLSAVNRGYFGNLFTLNSDADKARSIILKKDDSCIVIDTDSYASIWLQEHLSKDCTDFETKILAYLVTMLSTKKSGMKFPVTFVGERYFTVNDKTIEIGKHRLSFTQRAKLSVDGVKFYNMDHTKEYNVSFESYSLKVNNDGITNIVVFIR